MKTPRWTGWYLLISLLLATSLFCGLLSAIIAFRAPMVPVSEQITQETNNATSSGIRTTDQPDPQQIAIAMGLGAAGSVAFVLTSLIVLVWLLKAWSLIPDEHRTMSPFLMVFLLFIPFFNLYWMFRAIPGLSKALSETLRDQDLPEKAGYGAGMAACILTFIPGLNVFSGLAFIVWLDQANCAQNRLIYHGEPA